MSEDMIKDLLDLVKREMPSFTDGQADQIEKQIRRMWGGERFTVAKKAPRKKKEVIRKAVQEAKSAGVEAASKNFGISRRTIYRWLKK